MEPMDVFSRFLQKRNIEYVVGNSIKEMVELNYDKMDEQCLRGMANEAVSEYNELKGKGASAKAVSQSWSVIIDSVREVTAKNQADAEKNLTVLLEYSETVSSRMSVAIPSASSSGSKLSKDKSLIIAKCKSIYENGGCTKSFMEIMINTRNACKDNNANGQMDGHILQLEFFIKCFTTLLLKPRTTAAVTKEAPDNTYYDSASVVSTASQAPKTSSPPSSHRVLSVEEYNARVVTEESVESDGDDEEDDMYEEDEVPILEMLDFEAALVKAGKFVQLLLKKCAGNVSRLRDILVQLYRDNATTPDTPGEVPYHLNVWLKIMYKLRLLQGMLTNVACLSLCWILLRRSPSRRKKKFAMRARIMRAHPRQPRHIMPRSSLTTKTVESGHSVFVQVLPVYSLMVPNCPRLAPA